MAKIGTVQVEVKPEPNLDAWQRVCDALEEKVANAVARGVERGIRASQGVVTELTGTLHEDGRISFDGDGHA